MKREIGTRGIFDYEASVLPTTSGDSVCVRNIGLAAFDEKEYIVESRGFGTYYEITKK